MNIIIDIENFFENMFRINRDIECSVKKLTETFVVEIVAFDLYNMRINACLK
jgi:hypothetical protein